MLGIIFTTSMCWALVNCGVVTSSLPSMKFNIETADRLEDFTSRSTIYYSAERNALRLDLDGGMNKVFIDLGQNEVRYYYPARNTIGCWTFEAEVDVSNILPTVDELYYIGQEEMYDTPAEMYESLGHYKVETLWVMGYDRKTGIKNRPIRHVVKKWNKGRGSGRKSEFYHTVRTYYGFLVRETPTSVWDQSDADCQPANKLPIDIMKNTIYELTGIKMNAGSDWTADETKKKYATGWIPRSDLSEYEPSDSIELEFPFTEEQIASIYETLPTSFDWRDFGAVTPVKDQRRCGSCWAFGTVGSLEGAFFRKFNELVVLSEQALVDCAGSDWDIFATNGCYGGNAQMGYSWVKRIGGIPPAGEYPSYQEINGKCRVTGDTRLVAQLKHYHRVQRSTKAVKVALVKYGPLAVSIDAYPVLEYTNGVIGGDLCNYAEPDHTVLLVGYGESDTDGPYWIVKNSWGVDHGINGYFLVSAEGNCLGILDAAYFPVLGD